MKGVIASIFAATFLLMDLSIGNQCESPERENTNTSIVLTAINQIEETNQIRTENEINNNKQEINGHNLYMSFYKDGR